MPPPSPPPSTLFCKQMKIRSQSDAHTHSISLCYISLFSWWWNITHLVPFTSIYGRHSHIFTFSIFQRDLPQVHLVATCLRRWTPWSSFSFSLSLFFHLFWSSSSFYLSLYFFAFLWSSSSSFFFIIFAFIVVFFLLFYPCISPTQS